MAELTLGQQVVGITFNPSGNADVNKAKQHAADMIDLLCPDGELPTGNDLKSRIAGRAVNDVLIAQMLVVKALTFGLAPAAAQTGDSAAPASGDSAPAGS
jgi:hypothetical protein